MRKCLFSLVLLFPLSSSARADRWSVAATKGSGLSCKLGTEVRIGDTVSRRVVCLDASLRTPIASSVPCGPEGNSVKWVLRRGSVQVLCAGDASLQVAAK